MFFSNIPDSGIKSNLIAIFFEMAYNVLRAGDRNPVLRLRQGYGACTLLWAGF
jgi:hypothetical protein